MSSIPGHGTQVRDKKRTKNVRFLTIEGWNGAHCVAFLVLPQIMVRHLKIGPAVQKLGLIEVFKALGLKMTKKRSKVVVRLLERVGMVSIV